MFAISYKKKKVRYVFKKKKKKLKKWGKIVNFWSHQFYCAGDMENSNDKKREREKKI
jgi:hypothetical protein